MRGSPPRRRARGRWAPRALALVAPLALLVSAGCRREARGDTRAAAASSTVAPDAPFDSIAVRGPAGEPAARFPAPARPVSDIVSPRWSDEDARDDAGEAQRVLDLVGVRAGAGVADIGAGDGYYSVRAAARVGPEGRVWAEDIVPRYLALLQDRLRRDDVPNVALALGEPHDPRLPAASVDVALLVHMYHEIEQPFGLLYNLWPALRPGARVAILDLDRPTSAHGTPRALLRCELAAMGYTEEAWHDLAPGEYLAVFAPPRTRAALTPPESVSVRLARGRCAAGAPPATR
jgi:SAM-dependent methyltransferase